MGFWENVELIREYKDITRKELAYRAKFSLNSISTGIARKNIPAADVACRIAVELGVSVEYLVTGIAGNKQKTIDTEQKFEENIKTQNQIDSKYYKFIQDLKTLPEGTQKLITRFVHDMAKQ